MKAGRARQLLLEKGMRLSLGALAQAAYELYEPGLAERYERVLLKAHQETERVLDEYLMEERKGGYGVRNEG